MIPRNLHLENFPSSSMEASNKPNVCLQIKTQSSTKKIEENELSLPQIGLSKQFPSSVDT